MNRLFRSLAWLMLTAPAICVAAVLPLEVDVDDESATVRVGTDAAPLLDLRLGFDDATGLSVASLGVSADSVSTTSAALLARLPSTQVKLQSSLPVLLTVEPPTLGGLAFDRRVHVEVHTHALTYTAGSRFRLFKASLGGPFRDVTAAVEPGSVRTRGTTGGFSQFVVVKDLRPTQTVIDEKVQWLRDRIDLLPAPEAIPLHDRLDAVELAVAAGDWPTASAQIANFRARVAIRAGVQIPARWSADGSTANHAGELLSGLDTLEFSIAFLRDFGA